MKWTIYFAAIVSYVMGITGKYIPANMNDPIVSKTTDAFLKEYDQLMGDIFAVVPEKKILNAFVYEHPLEIDSDEEEDVHYAFGSTYKLNILFKLKWDTPTFPYRPFASVGYCIYTCTKDKNNNITCESKEFNELKRIKKSITSINTPHVHGFINRYMHHTYDDVSIHFTGYEIQHDEETNDIIEYIQFQIEEEPVSCQAVILNNGTTLKQSMLYFDEYCIKTKYQGISLMEYERRQHVDVFILFGGFILLIGTISFLVVYRRKLFSTKGAYRKLHIRFGKGGMPNPTVL